MLIAISTAKDENIEYGVETKKGRQGHAPTGRGQGRSTACCALVGDGPCQGLRFWIPAFAGMTNRGEWGTKGVESEY